MRGFLARRWFLIALVVLLVAGHWLGAEAPPGVLQGLDALFNDWVRSGVIAGVLFLMSVTLDGRRLRGAILAPGPVVWAVVVNSVVIPLCAPLLMPFQLHADFAIGVLIAASVPSTMAAASVWTRRAGGNDAISLLVTIVTNGACFLSTPFWLRLLADAAIDLDAWGMMQRLFLTTLVPTLCGQLCRWPPSCARLVDRWKTPLSALAQVGILLIVFTAACEAGRRLTLHTASLALSPPSLAAAIVMMASCVGLHLFSLAVAWGGAHLARFPRPDRIGVAFAASQKTLPVGILIATDPRMFGTDYPWAVYPMLVYHAAQLFLDTAIADWFHRQSAPAATVPAPPESEYDLTPEA